MTTMCFLCEQGLVTKGMHLIKQRIEETMQSHSSKNPKLKSINPTMPFHKLERLSQVKRSLATTWIDQSERRPVLKGRGRDKYFLSKAMVALCVQSPEPTKKHVS